MWYILSVWRSPHCAPLLQKSHRSIEGSIFYIFWSPATVKSNTIFGKTTLMALEKYSLEIEENFVYLCFGLAWWATATTPHAWNRKDLNLSLSILWRRSYDKTFAYNFWNEKNYTANPTLHDFYVSPDVMENPTYAPNFVSNILSCLTLPDFLTKMILIILTINMFNWSHVA